MRTYCVDKYPYYYFYFQATPMLQSLVKWNGFDYWTVFWTHPWVDTLPNDLYRFLFFYAFSLLFFSPSIYLSN